MMKWGYLAMAAMLAVLSMTNVALGEERAVATTLPAAYLMTDAQADTINSLARVNEAGTFYQLAYTADYRLDDLLAADISDLPSLIGWVKGNLLATGAPSARLNVGGGCSAFVGLDGDKLLYGRNYDYVQNAQNILVRCAPENGYQSVSIAAAGWIFPSATTARPFCLTTARRTYPCSSLRPIC